MLLKIFLILVLVVIESSLAKLRLFRIAEFFGRRFHHLGGGDDHLGLFDLNRD